ncbi:hypothetical protein MMC18_009620 [Xylographa bjoerkii]|nr:hypothetical protein [Xylographa bjoerkii]
MLRCKEWVTYCKENHRKLCEFIPAQYAVLRLIDCNAFKVVTATSKPLYVALSYTWGSNPINRGGDGFPRTIRDAIAVTKAVGYNYLWVDQYCIDQANNVEKHEQIQQMDLIYRGAELTVIVTVGSGVNDGLPGVLDTPRASTQVLDLEQYTLVFGMPHPHRTIPTTKWSTRAWTLQEATLSRRRLVFTEFQTYFECNGMNCCESFQENRQLLHSQKGDKALRFMHSGIFSTRATSDFTSFSTEKPELRLQRLREIIIEYSSRDLSYDEDSLNAIAGIITHFCEIEATSSTVSHLYGLPFLYRDGQIQHFSHGFLWIHDIKTSEDAYRRENFPSWSWVGWCGRIWFPTYIGISPDRIWLELVEGSRVLMTQHINRIISTKSPEQALPKVIYIDAEIMNVAEMRITAKGEAYKLRLGGHGGQLYWSGITPDPIELVQRFRNRRYDLLYLGETWHLVVENHPGFAARVGLAHIYCGRDDLLDYILERRHVRLY